MRGSSPRSAHRDSGSASDTSAAPARRRPPTATSRRTRPTSPTHHRMLAKLPDGKLQAEVAECQARLTAELGAPAIAISYPVGGPDACDARVFDAVRAQGFRIGFSYVSGTSTPQADNRYQLLRTPVETSVDLAWFKGILAVPELFSHPTRLRVYPS